VTRLLRRGRKIARRSHPRLANIIFGRWAGVTDGCVNRRSNMHAGSLAPAGGIPRAGLIEPDTDPEFHAPDHLTGQSQFVFRNDQCKFCGRTLWVKKFERCAGQRQIAHRAWNFLTAVLDPGRLLNTVSRCRSALRHGLKPQALRVHWRGGCYEEILERNLRARCSVFRVLLERRHACKIPERTELLWRCMEPC
jgi:hypothetical protein